MNLRANHTPPKRKDRNACAKTRRRAIHDPNPAGSKRIRRYFKRAMEVRGTGAEAQDWWKNYNPKKKEEKEKSLQQAFNKS